jgi:hypothetical protein
MRPLSISGQQRSPHRLQRKLEQSLQGPSLLRETLGGDRITGNFIIHLQRTACLSVTCRFCLRSLVKPTLKMVPVAIDARSSTNPLVTSTRYTTLSLTIAWDMSPTSILCNEFANIVL